MATTVEAKGEIKDNGTIQGKGTITLKYRPASAKLSLDYRKPDKLLLTLDARAGLRISRNKTLKLSGNLGRDFLRGTFEGKVKLQFEIPRTAAVELSHRVDRSGRLTTLRLSGKF